jgi:hypothetical protein
MDFTSLKEITETLIAIIKAEVGAGTSVIPEMPRNDRPGIGFYLFHAQESPQYKNYPSPGNNQPTVAFSPLSLNLFYQLSATAMADTHTDALEEQILMGAAMKALHDHPVVRKTIPGGKDIDIKVTLQHLAPSESVQYWAASESAVKLSAYYEVSVVFLEPEKPTTYTGRVLSYNNYLFLSGAPQITATSNTLAFVDPNGMNREVFISPAQAPADNTVPAPAKSVVTIEASGIAGGELSGTLLRSFGAANQKYLLPDASWNLQAAGENRVTMAVREKAVDKLTALPVDIVPGLYAIQIINTRKMMSSTGVLQSFPQTSNQFPFSVMPRIDSVTPTGAGKFQVTGYLFQHADITELKVFVGSDQLSLPPVPPGKASYTVANPTTVNIDTAGLPAGNKPVRILVNGIESEPRWITV